MFHPQLRAPLLTLEFPRALCTAWMHWAADKIRCYMLIAICSQEFRCKIHLQSLCRRTSLCIVYVLAFSWMEHAQSCSISCYKGWNVNRSHQSKSCLHVLTQVMDKSADSLDINLNAKKISLCCLDNKWVVNFICALQWLQKASYCQRLLIFETFTGALMISQMLWPVLSHNQHFWG